MQAYLFVHFREKTTPDGEQVYFGLSKDGFHWEAVNEGRPVLWTYYGEKGARDFTVVRSRLDGKFYIIGTDLSLAYGMRNQYRGSWEEISRNGSPFLSIWESENLVDWSEQRLLHIDGMEFGCLWAPDLIYDPAQENYILHWSSSLKNARTLDKKIYYSRTADFQHFTKPKILYELENGCVIDSAVYEEDGRYYLFVKNEDRSSRIQMLSSQTITGPYTVNEAFEESMEKLEPGVYEGPTAVRLPDGSWNLFLDYYGEILDGQGYVPFRGDSLKEGKFVREEGDFSFPYRFKHGTVLEITMEEYERIKTHDWMAGREKRQ